MEVPEPNNTAARAWVEQWYATPDAHPPGYWEALGAEIEANPVRLERALPGSESGREAWPPPRLTPPPEERGASSVAQIHHVPRQIWPYNPQRITLSVPAEVWGALLERAERHHRPPKWELECLIRDALGMGQEAPPAAGDTGGGELLDRHDTARLLGVKPQTVADARWRARVGLRATRVGRSLRFVRTDIEALLQRGREPTEGT
jgi:Helix-turn-helix domain